MKNIFSRNGSQNFYKPITTRTPVLLFLLAITLVLFGITELAIRNIPAHAGIGNAERTVNYVLLKPQKGGLAGRQVSAGTVLSNQGPTNSPSPTPSPVVSPSTPIAGGTGDSSSSSQTIYYTAKDGWLELGDPTTTPVITGVPQSGHLTLSKSPDPTPNQPSPVVNTNNNATPSPNPKATPTIYSSAAGGFLEPGKPPSGINAPGPNPTPPTPGVIPVPTNGPIQPISTPIPTAAVTDVRGSPVPVPVMTVVGGQTFAVTPTVNSNDGATYTPVLTIANGQTYAVTPSVTVKDGTTYTTTPSPSRVPIATGAPAGGYINPNPTDTASSPVSTIVNSTGTYFEFENGEIVRTPQISLQQYIYVAFLPLIVSVIYTIPWQILDTTVRQMEPFYQLNQDGGALGKNSLSLDYSTSWLIAVPFQAISRGHAIPFWSSLISISVLILAPISSEAFFVSVTGDCFANSDGACHASWGVYPALARAIEGILGFISVLLICLIFFNFRRQSGLHSEPFSLAGLGVLLSKSPLLKFLRQIDSMITPHELEQIVAGKRFKLAEFVAEDNTPCLGIVPMDIEPEAGFATIGSQSEKKGVYSSVQVIDDSESHEYDQQPQTRDKIKWHTGMSLKKDVKQKITYLVSLLIIAGLLTLITYYHWTGPDPVTKKSSGFETFMDSQGFGVRFMMSILGVGIKLLWGAVDSDLRRDQPYVSLIKGSAQPRDSIIIPFHAAHITAIIPALTRFHFLTAIVAFLAFVSEFLPITLANIAFSPAMTKQAYIVCHFISMSMLILMVIVMFILLVRPPGGVGSLPRRPGKGGIISTAIYLAAPSEADSTFGNVFGRESQRERGLLDGLAGLSKLSGKERDDLINGFGSLYSLGVVDGGDESRSSGFERRKPAGETREELRIDDDRRVRRLLRD